MKTHKDLDVWKFAIDFVINIYKATAQFPSEEKFGLMSQLRRASVTIPSNIAEGAARNHPKEFIQFLYIALSSAAEIETQLIICKNLNLIDEQIIIKLLSELETIAKMLNGLINSIKNK